MFLGIRKIGKSKHKFKAKIVFLKIQNQATPKGTCFKIRIQRGSHTIEAISEPNRRGVGKFEKKEYQIPLTLFFDEEEKDIKYLQKQATIKAYESDEQGNQIRKIGTKTINFSQYAGQDEFKLQVELDPQKSKDSPLLTLQIFLERHNEDSKSVETSQNNDVKSQNDQKDISAIKSQQDKKYLKIEQKIPAKQSKVSQKAIKSKNESVSQYDGEDQNKKKKSRSPFTKDPDVVEAEPPQKNIKNVLEGKDQQGSPELQVFLLKKMLKQKQLQLSMAKKQNDKLRKSVEKVIQQTSIAKQTQKKVGLESEIKQLKKVLVMKDTEIDRLTNENKTLLVREQNYEKTIMKLRQQTLRSKEKICDMKYRQAFLMQELFQTANKEGLEEASRFLGI